VSKNKSASVFASVVFLKVQEFARRPVTEQARMRAQLDAVVAVTTDPAAELATAGNAEANGVRVSVGHLDLREVLPPPAPVVAANLLSRLLIDWASRLQSAPDHLPGVVLASGILTHEAGGVAAAFARARLREEHRRAQGDWAVLLLRRSLP